jgi:hypothetical protein
MTLNTSIAIGKPTDVREVFMFCRKLLGCAEDVPFEQGVCGDHRQGQKQIMNPCGIGLPAWLWVYYGADGPMTHVHDDLCPVQAGPYTSRYTGKTWEITQEEVDEHARWVAGDPTENGWSAIEVTFDTAYGYRGKGGESCSDLHARLVTALGSWLDAKGLPWKWQNEYTGEWHDRFDQLDTFGNAHLDTGAEMWFECMVKPAIENGLLGGGSA